MTNSKMENTNKIVMTGWHTLSSTINLKPGFFGKDCEPLDANDNIPAGSTFKGKFSKSILGSSVHREWLNF